MALSIVAPVGGMATIFAWLLNSVNKTNLSRFFSEAPWLAPEMADRRITYMLEQSVLLSPSD